MALDPMTTAALISGGSRLIGGLFGSSSASKQRSADAANMAADRALQKEFAQYGVRWKVEDAKAAGLHPLAALGIQTHSASPVAIGTKTDRSMQNAMEGAGQDISRAMMAKATKDERLFDLTSQRKRNRLLNEGLMLDNQLKLAQLHPQSQQPPPMPDGIVDITSPPETGSFLGNKPNAAGAPPWKFGPGVKTEDIEKWYGEPGEWAYGAASIYRDIMRNAKRQGQYWGKRHGDALRRKLENMARNFHKSRKGKDEFSYHKGKKYLQF